MKMILAVLLAIGCMPALAQDGSVVVYRPSKFVGSALKPSVYVDGYEAGRLENGRYISLRLVPGKHSFASSMKSEAALEMDIKSNEAVYLEMVILPGNWRGGGRLIPVGQEDARNALLKLKPLKGQQAELPETTAMQSAQPEPSPADNSQPEPHVQSEPPANVLVKSTPAGADINVDGKYMGSTPSTIQLVPGEHQVSIEKESLRSWQRTMTVSTGGSLIIDATLEKP
jgi:hypothetical protein